MKTITKFVNEDNQSIYDVFGNSLKIGDSVIFYCELGDESKENKVITPRLYEGKLKSWDSKKLEGTIESKDFDQHNYNIPKTLKVHQRLIVKI